MDTNTQQMPQTIVQWDGAFGSLKHLIDAKGITIQLQDKTYTVGATGKRPFWVKDAFGIVKKERKVATKIEDLTSVTPNFIADGPFSLEVDFKSLNITSGAVILNKQTNERFQTGVREKMPDWYKEAIGLITVPFIDENGVTQNIEVYARKTWSFGEILDFYKDLTNLSNRFKKKAETGLNLHSAISENLICHHFPNLKRVWKVVDRSAETSKGDFYDSNICKFSEGKGASSDGPTSFSTKPYDGAIYFCDVKEDTSYDIYVLTTEHIKKCRTKNAKGQKGMTVGQIWENNKKTNTKSGVRPRLCLLKECIIPNNIKPTISGFLV